MSVISVTNPKRASMPCLALLAFSAVLLLAGCATGGAGGADAMPPPPSDEELIDQLLQQNLGYLASGDLESLMVTYADDFSSDQGMNKEGMTTFLQTAKDQGFLEGFTSDTASMEITVVGDTATASGIVAEGAFGVLNLTFGLAKRDGQWVVVSQSQEQ